MTEVGTPNWVEPLNLREIEVVGLVSEGLSNSEIANSLHLSIDTVKWYNKQIYSKLGVKNRTQAAKKVKSLNPQKTESDLDEPKRSRWLSNLPAQLTSYVGRENEISEIKDLLRHNRMVSLTGSGGSGKTRLALKVADDLLEYYRDGVWFVELDSFYGIAIHIASFAGSVGALGYHLKAARLFGAANAQLDTLEIGQQPADKVEIRHYINDVQQALGENAFNKAWEEGQRMTIQEAIEYAVSDLEEE